MKNIKKNFTLTFTCLILLVFTLISCTQPLTNSSSGTKKVTPKSFSATARQAALPFPQNINYTGCIKPNEQVDQIIMNRQVKQLYVDWIRKYVKPSNGGTPGGGYYVHMNVDPTGGKGKTSSEAHGYGMLVFAMMAGVDLSDLTSDTSDILDAKTYYDGMYNMYDKHRSKVNNHLMSWVITESESTEEDSDSATDGDMDIAYSLVMAHDQWGSNGSINYIAEAQRMAIFGIKKSDISPVTKRVMLGDWSDWSSSIKSYGTRPSDWMAGHMRVFKKITNDVFWDEVREEIYRLTDELQRQQTTGLLPDFAVGEPPVPAYEGWWEDEDGWLEGPHDGDYGYNACRFPWRIAADYALYNESRAKTALDKISAWLIPAHTELTGDPQTQQYLPGEIVCGYYLDGKKITWPQDPPQWHGMSFTAPFTLACMVSNDATHQNAVNKGWWEMVTTPEGYYEDSINLLCALLLTGNWWDPGIKDIPPPPSVPEPKIVDPFSHQDYVPPSQLPPGGIPVHQAPMFVTIGFDDNSINAGMEWADQTLAGNKTNPAGSGNAATYDGEPISFSFYNATFYKAQAGSSWTPIMEAGRHETGNHSDAHSHGDGFSESQWSNQITTCEAGLSDLLGSTITMHGWRTPYLEYNNELFGALKSNDYWYDCSIEEGFKWGMDGTNFYWPYTLDEGSPGHNVLYEWGTKKFKVTSHPGLWEMPVHCVIVPTDEQCAQYGIEPGFRKRLKGLQTWFDEVEGKITGFDYNLLYSFRMNRAEFGGTLMNTLELRLQGNRAPFMFGGHTEYYSGSKNPPGGLDASQGGIEDFVNHALTKPEVRIVHNKKILDWIRHPVAIDGTTPVPTATPTSTPDYPTPTATPTATATPILENLALNKTIQASSVYAAQYPAINANDGNPNSVWGSKTGNSGEYIFVDLGGFYDVSKVKLQWYNPYFAHRYQVYVSNDATNWSLINDVSGENGGIDDLPSPIGTNGRYVGIYLMGANSLAYGLSELEVWGYKPLPTPTPTATPLLTPTPTATPTVPPVADPWAPGVAYEVGSKVTYENALWVCNTKHTSIAGWYPGAPGVYLWDKQ